MRWIVYVLAFLGFLFVAGILWLMWRKNKNIKDIKRKMEVLVGLKCSNAKPVADCVVDKYLATFGYIRTMELLGMNEKPTDKEMDTVLKFYDDCGCQE